MQESFSNQMTFGFQESSNLFDYLETWSSDDGFHPKPANESTQCEPGSIEKIEVLISRLNNNEELWHPDDKRVDLPTETFARMLSVNIPNF